MLFWSMFMKVVRRKCLGKKLGKKGRDPRRRQIVTDQTAPRDCFLVLNLREQSLSRVLQTR